MACLTHERGFDSKDGYRRRREKVVTFSAVHEHRVVTDPARPVPRVRYGPLEVVSIFRRQITTHDTDDGNPLIYALKGKFGYTMPYRDFRLLFRAAKHILPNALGLTNFDLVVPLPSSSPVAAILAARAVRQRMGCSSLACLQKATIGEVLAGAPAAGQIRRQHRGEYTSQLAKLQRFDSNLLIEMKTLKGPIRPYFAPVVANGIAGQCAGRHVLLVDDILSSGSSLAAAEAALNASGAASVSALTLLSRLR
jgi:hypothetical protein